MSVSKNILSIYLLLTSLIHSKQQQSVLALENIPQGGAVAVEQKCSLKIGDRDNQDEANHRRMVSVENLPPSCTNSRIIQIDIPHDGIKRSFSMAKATTKHLGVKPAMVSSFSSFSSLPSPVFEYDYWVGEDPVDGSIFNYVQDSNGNISGSMVDLTNHDVLQFHNRNGSYMVTITASSDFPPEDDGIHHEGEERKLMNDNNKDSTSTITESTTPLQISTIEPNRSLKYTSASQDAVIPSFLQHVNAQTTHQESRKLYDDLGGNLDIMVVWTASAECNAYGQNSGCTLTSQSEENMLALINLAVEETNDAYQASGINTELLLVHAYRHPSYVESSFSGSLSDIQSGSLSGVHSNRASYGADLVALLIDDSQYCGLAYIGPNINSMFSVTAWNCATGYYSFGHEVGHNLGCLHDRGASNACSSGGYNYGYRDANANFRTVLAYNCVAGQCDNNTGGGCSRIPRYSNPNFTYNGSALGSSSIDNARQINDVRETVARYYTHVSSPTPTPPTPTPPTPTPPTPTPPTPTPPSPTSPTPTPPTPTLPTSFSCGNSICEVNQGEGCSSCPADCSFPTNCNTVFSNFVGGGFYGPTSYGIVFDVMVATDLFFYGIDVLLISSSGSDVKVYMKSGSFVFDSNLNNWDLVFDGFISDYNEMNSINFSSRFYAPSGSKVAFYVSYATPGAFVFDGPGDASNDDVTIKSGNVLIKQTGNTLPSLIYSNYAFVNSIKYDYAISSPVPPTPSPVDSPIFAPVAPTSAPITPTSAPITPTSAPVAPTSAPVAPTSAPVAPTSAPESSPTLSPEASPTFTPAGPTSAPEASSTLSPEASPILPPVSFTPAPVTLAPAPAPTPTTPITCKDSPLRIKLRKNGRVITRSCQWVSNRDTISRCALDGISSMCPSTCGTCSPCTDGKNRVRFLWNNNFINRDCTWVGRKQVVARCAIIGMKDTCRVTCNNC